MNESSNAIERLAARLQRGLALCDRVEQRAIDIDARFGKFAESIQTLSRLFDVSCLIVIASDQDKQRWLQLIDGKPMDLADPALEQFIYRLELHLGKTIGNDEDKRAYLQTLSSLRSVSNLSSGLFN